MVKKIVIFGMTTTSQFMDNRLRDVFFQLVRIGLWNKGSLVLNTALSEADWLQIRSYAIHHTVEGLIYDSFPFLEEQQLPPQSLRLKWTVRVDQIERHNAKMNEVIAAQYTAFTKEGLRPILQKGQGVAACYEIPHHRMSGDIDWYFEEKGYAKAREILKEKQLDFQDTAGFSLFYEWQGIAIEHHKRLFHIRNPLQYRYLGQLQRKYFQHQQGLILNGTTIKTLAPELQLLQVNVHIFKHLLSFGIGLRQLCDSARLYHTVSTQVDPQALKEIYTHTGILAWTHLLHIILVKHLGLPEQSVPFPYPEKWDADWMMDEIFYSGNFGYHDERYKDGSFSPLSARPAGVHRIWSNMKRYFKYAPQEVFFYPFVQLYSKVLGIDDD
ncbi:nucleotidyltransferase family protein [Sphingobacterium sp. ML3W]|uniref:nucleotidyltransferase domain-containing protein n=1 Tax=Sphingobacterium sp. ML3W TaxID=1538644 RepID=UPI000691AF70|nr:nucleotidyltransferase family protein [Sphingobacterium sp. ML3W]